MNATQGQLLGASASSLRGLRLAPARATAAAPPPQRPATAAVRCCRLPAAATRVATAPQRRCANPTAVARSRRVTAAPRRPSAPPSPHAASCQAAPGEVRYTAIGRRKTATARVSLVPGTGVITFNGRAAVEYLGFNPAYVAAVRDPLEILGLDSTYDVLVSAHGGGVMGQAEAARLGISRALVDIEAANRPALKAEGFMTRDPRAVERKKYGLAKARKAHQYSKR